MQSILEPVDYLALIIEIQEVHMFVNAEDRAKFDAEAFILNRKQEQDSKFLTEVAKCYPQLSQDLKTLSEIAKEMQAVQDLINNKKN